MDNNAREEMLLEATEIERWASEGSKRLFIRSKKGNVITMDPISEVPPVKDAAGNTVFRGSPPQVLVRLHAGPVAEEAVVEEALVMPKALRNLARLILNSVDLRVPTPAEV